MFRRLPPFGGDQRSVAEVVNNMMDGKTNNTGSVTLATGGATTTTITDARIGIDSIILLMPTFDASSLNQYISTVATGSAVITHAANSTANRKLKYIVVG